MRALCLALLIAGCDERRTPEPDSDYRRRCSPTACGDIFQLDYPDAGVTCWALVGLDKGGISCLEVCR